MAITPAAGTGVVITSAAKNGTLGSQAAASSTQIIFDTDLTTNNGQLANTSFIGRLVIVRRGTGTEETRYMIAESGTTVTVHEAWTVQPVEKPAPTTQPKHVSDEEKVQRLRGVIADLQKEKEEKQKIKEEAFHNQNQQKLLEKQAKVNKIVESYRKEEKAKQIIAESRKS